MTRIEYYCSVTQKRIIGLTKVTMTELDMMVRITYRPIITYQIIVIIVYYIIISTTDKVVYRMANTMQRHWVLS